MEHGNEAWELYAKHDSELETAIKHIIGDTGITWMVPEDKIIIMYHVNFLILKIILRQCLCLKEIHPNPNTNPNPIWGWGDIKVAIQSNMVHIKKEIKRLSLYCNSTPIL